MENWIDRYILAVVGRLPEDERAEVERELRSNIYDMLSEDPTKAELEQVLHKMGSPAELAEQYRQNPRYLISPQVYDDYIRLLKILVPIIGIITLIVGVINGGIDAFRQDGLSANKIAQMIIQTGIQSGVSGVMQTLIWTTVGFMIADRTGALKNKKKEAWKLEDLPSVSTEKLIPISDALGEIIAVLVFGVILLLWALNILPSSLVIYGEGMFDAPLFTQSFLFYLIPVLIVGILLTVIANIFKLIDRRWTNRVCGWAIADSVITAIMWVFLLMKSNIFHPRMIQLLQEHKWPEGDVLHYISSNTTEKIRFFLGAIIVIVSIIQIIIVVYHRAKAVSLKNHFYENRV